MTAPAVTTQVTPQAPKSAGEQLRQDDVAFMQTFGMGEMLKQPETPAPEAPKIEAETPKVETPKAEAPKVETPAPETKEPEAPAEEPAPETPKRELVTEFKAFDTQGELDAHSVADVEVEFEANGKVRREPIDKVVRLAKMGFYNEEREQQVVQTRQENAQLKTEYERSLGYVKQIATDLESMYADESDALYVQARDAWRQKNTPEAQLQRERDRNNQLMSQQREREEAQQVTAFSGQLASSISGLQSQYSEVTTDEVLGRLNRMSLHLYRNGRVPPEHFAAYEQVVKDELTPWVQQLHDSRSEGKAAQQREATKREKVARTEAHLAKRQLTRAIPGANSTPSSVGASEPQKPLTFQKASDILDHLPEIVKRSAAG